MSKASHLGSATELAIFVPVVAAATIRGGSCKNLARRTSASRRPVQAGEADRRPHRLFERRGRQRRSRRWVGLILALLFLGYD